jgi:hypothetical protein
MKIEPHYEITSISVVMPNFIIEIPPEGNFWVKDFPIPTPLNHEGYERWCQVVWGQIEEEDRRTILSYFHSWADPNKTPRFGFPVNPLTVIGDGELVRVLEDRWGSGDHSAQSYNGAQITSERIDNLGVVVKLNGFGGTRIYWRDWEALLNRQEQPVK